jgi:oligopeptide transport system permease protein
MGKYIFHRLIYMVITMFIIASATFFLMKLMPGTPLSLDAKLTEKQEAVVLEKYGLNDPIPVQYVKYMGNILKGDLGVSFQFDNRQVTGLILSRLGPSMELGAYALIFGSMIGIILGIISAMYHNSFLDYGSTFLAVIGKSIPNFVFAGLLQYYVGVKLGWLPVAYWESFKHTIMPTLALSMFPIAVCARFMRTEMIEVLGQDFIVTAKAKGISRFRILTVHALRNALIPVVTIMGPLVVFMMTGSLVIENIFSVPGIGEQFVRSIMTNDYPVIMGTTLLLAAMLIVVIFIVDLLYGIIDPRIRIAGGKE